MMVWLEMKIESRRMPRKPSPNHERGKRKLPGYERCWPSSGSDAGGVWVVRSVEKLEPQNAVSLLRTYFASEGGPRAEDKEVEEKEAELAEQCDGHVMAICLCGAMVKKRACRRRHTLQMALTQVSPG